MSSFAKVYAVSDELEWFFLAALSGKIHIAKGGQVQNNIGSQTTPVSSGLSEGYSEHDMASFYIARELGTNWKEGLLKHLSEGCLNAIGNAMKACREDVLFEKDHLTNQEKASEKTAKL